MHKDLLSGALAAPCLPAWAANEFLQSEQELC